MQVLFAIAIVVSFFQMFAGQSGKPGDAPKAVSVANAVAHKADATGGRHYFLLPLTGKYRFPVPEGINNLADLRRSQNGYLDRFGSEWVPYIVKGRVVSWRCNLSERGKIRMGGLVNGRDFFLVGVDGKKIDASGKAEGR